MEIEELGRAPLIAVGLEILDWTPSKQKKLTELCVSFHMDEIALPCHVF